MTKVGISPKVRELVIARADGLCEVCCNGDQAEQLHHRRARGMGSSKRASTNLPSNLLAASSACHARVEAHRLLSLSNGWLVSSTVADPSAVPVKRRGRLVLLDNFGGFADQEVSF